MPSKLAGMLASGRPIVAMAVQGTELSDVVRDCGVQTLPGDLDGFAEGVRYLSEQPILRSDFGRVGRRFAEENLSAESVIAKLASDMQLLVDHPEHAGVVPQ